MRSVQPTAADSGNPVSLERDYDDNALAQQLFGPHHAHLAQLEGALNVAIDARGNRVVVTGGPESAAAALTVLDLLYRRLQAGREIHPREIDGMVRMTAGGRVEADADLAISLRHRTISARSPNQAAYLRAIDQNDLVFGIGPAGTGKTYLAVAKAVERLVKGDVDRIILSRPAVEAGEQLGFLPGSMREKVDPYLRPLYDALYDMLPAQQVVKRLDSGEIEVAPLAFMRGRTLANAFVILDEAQNTTGVQMKMFLTRLGENARMVVTGDLSQVDLPKGTRSGLRQAQEILDGVPEIAFIRFTEADVVRHPLVARIVHAYDEAEERLHVGAQYEGKE